jgi:hypothetical protein
MKIPPLLREDVLQHRADREQLLSELRAVERAPIPAATAEARVDALIAEALTRDDPFHGFGNHDGAPYTVAKFNQLFLQSPLAALARIAPKGLRAAMLAAVEPGGLTPKEREAKLAAIGDQIFQCEIAEEQTLRLIDAQTGGLEYRRPDARADIMLAPDGELETASKEPAVLTKALRKAS